MQFNREIYQQHCRWMQYALTLAKEAEEAGEVPVGAVLVDQKNSIVATGTNRKERDRLPTAHGEIVAINRACEKRSNCYLNDLTLYVTLEPCPMCAGAIIQARVGTLVYGADDPKTGAVRTVLNLPDSAASNHHLHVISGVLSEVCRQQLKAWFSQKRI